MRIRPTAALVVYFLAGCTEPATPDHAAWSIDPACEAPSAADLAALEAAAALWAEFGRTIDTDRADSGAARVTLCFVVGPAMTRDGYPYRGRTLCDDLDCTMRVTAGSGTAVMAHEFGHIFLPGGGSENHLEPGQRGIMGSTPLCRLDDCTWSDADRAFVTLLLASL